MTVHRITDANLHFSGSEMKFVGTTEEISQTNLILALNWYSRTKGQADAETYAENYFKKYLKYNGSLKEISPTFGFICRIVTNGGILPNKYESWFNKEIERIKECSKTKKSTVEVVNTKPTIQDRLKEKSNLCIAELEGLFDELISSKFKAIVSPYSVLHTLEIKNTKDILEWSKERRQEYANLLTTIDEQLLEAYSNFTKFQIKKIVTFFDQVILDCAKLTSDQPKVTRTRTRKVKTKTPDQILAKLQYCPEFPTLNLKSVDPKSILGATQLWVYNTKYKKLGIYYATDASGFSVLGTTLKNFDETKSIQKSVRKPELTIPELLKAGKIALRTFMNKISTVETKLSGRIGQDTILLRVTK